MRPQEPAIKDAKKKLWVILILALLLMMGLTACKQDQLKIEADGWMIDETDSTLFRVVKKNGREYEEFLEIKDNKEMKRFLCFTDTDRKKWAEVLSRECR